MRHFKNKSSIPKYNSKWTLEEKYTYPSVLVDFDTAKKRLTKLKSIRTRIEAKLKQYPVYDATCR